jgi:hypothetical protein
MPKQRQISPIIHPKLKQRLTGLTHGVQEQTNWAQYHCEYLTQKLKLVGKVQQADLPIIKHTSI